MPLWIGPSVFLISAAVLAAQVVLLRIFSIESFHHFAYMAIGMALLGFGASGTFLVLLQRRIRGRLDAWFETLSIAFPLTLFLTAWAADRIPFEATQLLWAPEQWGWLLLMYGTLTAPFLVAAGALGIALMAAGERVGRIYAWSLVGSGLGSALALALLTVARPDRALAGVVVMASAGTMAAMLARGWSRGRTAVATGLTFVSCVSVLAPPWSLTVTPFKGLPQVTAFPDAHWTDESWGPTGWAVAVESPAFRHAPGLSLAYTGELPRQTALFVDGETAGARTLVESRESMSFLDWLPSSAAYAMGPVHRVLVLGSGGGLEVLNAVFHGADHVTDVELVGPLVELRGVLGPRTPDSVRLRTVIGDARSFVARPGDSYDLIVLPVSGAMPATAAGVYSLGEDYLDTVEAYRRYLRRLTPQGVLTITRWLRTPPRDNVRLILTAAEALREEGLNDVGGSLVFVRSWGTGTLLVSPGGFDPPALDAIQAFVRQRRFDLDWPPVNAPSFNIVERPVLAEAAAAAAAGVDEARGFERGYPFRVGPTTDDRPYFGRFLRAGTILELLGQERGSWLPFAEWGTLAVIATLVQSGLLALVLVGLPVGAMIARRETKGAVSLALYFGALGFGYVFLEMGAIQRLGLLLGHPVYAAAATLAVLLTFSGVGSALSDRLPARWGPRVCIGVALLTVSAALLSPVAAAVASLPVGLRVTTALVVVALPGTLMGMPFPSGLRYLARREMDVAWAWATNGVASVLGASLAILIAMEMGGRGLLALAGGLYLAAGVVFSLRLHRAAVR